MLAIGFEQGDNGKIGGKHLLRYLYNALKYLFIAWPMGHSARDIEQGF